MDDIDIFEIFLKRFIEADIEFFVTGSVATIIYGEPRLTNDVDLVLNINKDEVSIIIKKFPLEAFYVPPQEVILTEILRKNRGHFNIIHLESGLKADIYLIGSDDFMRWALGRRKFINFKGLQIPIAPPEYVILKKLEFYQEGKSQKHLDDIKGVLENSRDLIDMKFLIDKAKEKSLYSILQTLLKKN